MINQLNKNKLISMFEAAKLCPYEQDYVSLLARRGLLKAEKIGRKWYTTVEWLNDYLKKMRPNEIIEIKSEKLKIKSINSNTDKKRRRIFENGLILKPLVFWFLSVAGIVILIAGIYEIINRKVEKIEANAGQFIPEEITKIPNETGGYNIYSEGRMKVGEEESVSQNSIYLAP